ncbi:MAG: hypothetical protein ACXVI1_10025 [Halobacteriota archaeon]
MAIILNSTARTGTNSSVTTSFMLHNLQDAHKGAESDPVPSTDSVHDLAQIYIGVTAISYLALGPL